MGGVCQEGCLPEGGGVVSTKGVSVGLLEWFRMKQTKMYVCTLEEFILVEIWIHCCTKLN